jgi:hypothetical protein
MTFDNTSGNKEADEKRAKDQRERMEAETKRKSMEKPVAPNSTPTM